MSANYLPAGKWEIYANGFKGDLVVNFVDSSRFVGTVFGDPINGIWQEGIGKISFTRGGTSNQIYHGYLAFPQLSPFPVSMLYTLAGTFDDAAGTYGWFAQRHVVQ
jgi:hypothetical protein